MQLSQLQAAMHEQQLDTEAKLTQLRAKQQQLHTALVCGRI